MVISCHHSLINIILKGHINKVSINYFVAAFSTDDKYYLHVPNYSFSLLIL